MLIDLTEAYGEGNEPELDVFENELEKYLIDGLMELSL